MSLPKRAHERLLAGLKKYQPIFEAAKKRDVSESDTAVMIADFLADVLGYAKYTEITTEFAIRGTYCDLAVKLDDKLAFLIEVKAIGVDLKENHVKQAVDYAANKGCEWVMLTNGVVWRVYKVGFGQPITNLLVTEVDLLKHPHRHETLVDCFGSLSREGWTKEKISDYLEQMQASSRYTLAATLLSEPVLTQVRREIRRLFPGVKLENDFLGRQIRDEVLKRELVEGEAADTAMATLKKLARRADREREKAKLEAPAAPPAAPSAPSEDRPAVD
jgi:hypothetical protein